MPQLNLNQKVKIFNSVNSPNKTCISSLARELGCKRGAIYYQINRLSNSNGNLNKFIEKKRSKSTSYTNQEEASVLSFFDLHPFASFKDCKIFLNLNFTIPTIRNILLRNSINTYVAKRKPFMNLSHQAKR